MNDPQRTRHPAHLWEGFWGIQLLYIGQSLGLFCSLSEPMKASELASKLQLEARYTERWCSAASASGLLEHKNGRYQTPPELKEWLTLSRGFTESHLHLSQRLNETFHAVLSGRALPEPPIALRLMLSESLLRNYLWLFEQVPSQFPDFAKALQTGSRALEIGCGLGQGLGVLRSHFSHLELYGIEADFECAREAERVTRAVVHVAELPGDRFGKTFDIVLCFRALASASKPEELLDECSQLLSPGGWLILGTELQDHHNERKSHARSLGELFAYQMLMGEANVNFFTDQKIQDMLGSSQLKVEAKVLAPDWGTPVYLCTHSDKT